MKNDHEYFMRLAIAKTRRGIALGQTPFGACIVRDGKVVACEHNRVWKTTDITAHGEIVTLRRACKKMSTIDLSGCDIYSTCEPCPMCFSACHWANIRTIYFGSSIADARRAGFNELSVSDVTLKKLGKSNVKIVSGILHDETQMLFREWKNSGKARTY